MCGRETISPRSKPGKGKHGLTGKADYMALGRDLVDAVESGVYIVQSRKFVYVNPFFAKLTGYSPEELIGTRSLKLVLAQDRPTVRKKATRNLKSRTSSKPYEYRFIKKNGEIIWVLERISSIEYMGQKAALGSLAEITGRKHLEEALAHSEKTYRTILEQMYDSYYEVDLAGNFTFVNDAVCRNLGYSSEEIIGQSYRFTTPPDDIKPLLLAFNEVFRTGIPNMGFAHGILRKDGSIISVESSISLRENEQGEIIGFRSVSRDITERKKAEAALKDSEERYRALFDRSLNLVYVRDLKGNFIDANPAALNLLGYRREDIPSLNFTSLLDNAQFPKTIQILKELTETGFQKEPSEFKLKLRDGTYLYVETQESMIYRDGKPHSVQGVGRDITERKKAEIASKESEEKYRTLFNKAPVGIAIFTTEATIVDLNETQAEMTGYTVKELSGKLSSEYFADPDKRKEMLEIFQKDGKLRDFEIQLRKKDGSIVTEILNFDHVQIGGSGFILSTGRDVTALRQAETALMESEEQLRTAMENAPDGILIIDLKGNILYGNHRCEKISGYKREDLLGKNFMEANLLHENSLAAAAGLLQLSNEDKSTSTDELVLIRKDGSLVPVEINTSNLQRKGQSVVLAFVRDITKRKQSEEALRNSEEKYRSLVENINDVFYTLDTQGNITYVSPVVERLTKYRISDLLGKPFIPLIYPDDLPGLLDSLNRLTSGQMEPWEFRILDKDGRIISVRTSSRPLYEDGEIVGIAALMMDVTGRKQMEQKLEEMATHDFLTGMPNRVLLLDRFNIAAALARRNKTRLAVMSLDLDQFKTINDTLGHDAGDQVLKTISARLTGIIRASDTLARVGGDEFTLLMMETKQREDAAAVAQKFLDSFREPLVIDGHQLIISTSIGIAIYPDDAEELETLNKKSDAAMYYSKGHGRNQFKFFGDGDVRISGDHRSGPD